MQPQQKKPEFQQKPFADKQAQGKIFDANRQNSYVTSCLRISFMVDLPNFE